MSRILKKQSNINTGSDKLFHIKLKLSFIYKKIKRFSKIYFTLPHIWILIIILILCFISLGLSLYYKSNNLVSSVFANIFAGLITGLVISLITLIKGVSLYKIQSKIGWLKEIHNQCLEFLKESRKLYLSKPNDFTSDEEKYNKVYDLLCLGNNISVFISQGQFNGIYPFNTYKLCKKNFDFDSIEQERKNGELRDKIIDLDISEISSKEIKNLFRDMENSIFSLNSNIINEIKQLEIKNKAINIT